MSKTITHPVESTGLHETLILLLNWHADFNSAGDVRVLTEEARLRGWRILDYSIIGGSLMHEPPVSGIITSVLPPDARLTRFLESGCPVIRVGQQEHVADEFIPAVLPDFQATGLMAANYFAERGFQHLGLVGLENMFMLPLIEAGIRGVTAANGCDYACLQLGPDEADRKAKKSPECMTRQYDTRVEVLGDWVKGLPRPLALIACSPQLANMLGLACLRNGIAVPEEVSLLSIGNNLASCMFASVPISAVDQNIDNGVMKRIAVNLLDQLIKGKSVPPRTYVAPCQVVTRRSSDIFAVEDPIVSRAVRFIWDNLAEDISVDNISEAVKTPRYKLERLFRQYLKRGIHEELRRVRLGRFAEHLRSTDLPVRKLAPLVGFNSEPFLHKSFCREYGMTPRQYRLQK